MQRIFCLYTGGTIGCAPSPTGLIPQSGILTQPIRDLAQQTIPGWTIDFHELSPPLDSSSMGPTHWRTIAETIQAQRPHYQAIIILHGTDTLAWTAAALHWQLGQLEMPVIITGSQCPWLQPGSDAPANVALALRAATQGAPGVQIAFGGEILSGVASKKLDADADAAFGAPNAPTQAWAGDGAPQWVDPSLRIVAVKLYPGSETLLAQWLTSQQLDGLVLESYGSGNLPACQALHDALQLLASTGCIIINCTQCIAGEVRQGLYATGDSLNQLGAWPAGRRSAEAAVTWLYTQLGRAEPAILQQRWQSVALL
ncbi:asparaginase domain-containing protein [Chitinibacter tainanensis]|uniref:asparaginase domain-containing protein n=1 Tax=Chitinibacter tainanensis TaxID=230667 RepID=UPI0004208AB9|nr:asparaginase domain-containing protein [Chitinibacter tainanensis]